MRCEYLERITYSIDEQTKLAIAYNLWGDEQVMMNGTLSGLINKLINAIIFRDINIEEYEYRVFLQLQVHVCWKIADL